MPSTLEDLRVWQLAMDLIPTVYALAKTLPPEERYALGDQLRRAVISVAANIAEGQARYQPKEFIQFLSIAKGSLAETETLLLAAVRLGYFPSAEVQIVRTQIDKIQALLDALRASILKSTGKR